MRLVERRAVRELQQNIKSHFEAWDTSAVVGGGANNGFYPFAVPWNDPSATAVQVGTNNTTSGLLPLSSTPLTWSNMSSSCSLESPGVMRCQALCVILLGIPVCLPDYPSGQVTGIATQFVDPPGPGSFQFVGLSLGGSANWTLNKAARRLEFSYSGFVNIGNLDIRVTAPQPSAFVTGWLANNNWHQNAYYAFAPGFAIDGNDLCGGQCFTINSFGASATNKHAIVVMTGRSLPGIAPTPQAQRPVGAPFPVPLGEFLEDANSDGTALVFELKARTTTFNDTPVAVRP